MTAHCTVTVTHTKVKVEENRRKATFLNPDRKRYKVTQVDNCVVTEGVRADFLVSEVGEASALVELKGKNVEHACNQLFASARHPSVTPLLEQKKGFVVVCSKWPRVDSFVLKAKDRARKEFGAGFHVFVGEGEFEMQQIAAINGRPKR
jgi:hypothetical protein